MHEKSSSSWTCSSSGHTRRPCREGASSRRRRSGLTDGKADDRRAVFLNARTAVRLVVHGDDFTYSGTKKLIKDRGMMGSEKERNQGGDDLGAGGEMGGGGAGE